MECLHSNWITHICSFPKEISYLRKKNLKDIMITTEKKKKEIISRYYGLLLIGKLGLDVGKLLILVS